MPHRQNKPSTALGAASTTVERGIAQAESVSIQDSTSAHSGLDSDQFLPFLVRKAAAVLKDELERRASRGTGVLPGDVVPDSQDLETAMEAFRQQPDKLVDTVMEVPKHRPEQLAQLSSQLIGIGGLPPGEDFPSLCFLTPPPPVTPGKVGQVALTLVNDDPKETVECNLHSTDLLGRTGNRIPAEQIYVSPNPVKVPPGKTADVQIDIRVPNGTPPGSYAGLLQADDVSPLQVLQLSVRF